MTKQIDVINEVQQNFIDSSYDVNTNRAFPNVKDGLKPGQRACIWEMYTKGYTSNKPHVKSAKIDGGVAALWWPHGTTAIYETFARMSQPFTNNIPEIDFHGSNGNIIIGGDALAADRYTEAKLSKITEEGMLKGINKNNVPMIPNFSEDEEWPQVLPAVFPRLLVNGSQGIGVSLANVFLPHNFTETADLILEYIKTGNLNEEEYYPDFPTGGTIINKDELSIINKTGKGKVILQASYKIEEQSIIFYEMPYQVYIEPLIEKIKSEIEAENITGIDDVINKSDKNKIALVVECQKGVNPETVLIQLFNNTPLQSQYNANQNGIISKTPILLNLKQIVNVYIEHNTECIKREFKFDLEKTNARIEIIKGLLKALVDIDNIISIIKQSDNPTIAEQALIEKYSLTQNQAKAILDMKLSKLTKLDGIELNNELNEKQEYANKCATIVDSIDEQKSILVERLLSLKNKFGDARRTKVIQKEIVKNAGSRTKTERPVEDVVVTYNPIGYLQRIPITSYRKTNLESFRATTTDYIIMFSNFGKFYRISVSDIKSCGIKDKGTAIGSIINLEKDEYIDSVFSSDINESKPYLFFAMSNGIVKKSEKINFIGSTRNLNGMVAVKLNNNEVVKVSETNGDYVTLNTKNGYHITFRADDVRATGKSAAGVKGINLADDDKVIACFISDSISKDTVLQKRGGKGKKNV